MNTREAVGLWIEVYTAAWQTGELSRLEKIYSPTGRTLSAPFRASESALEYQRRVLAKVASNPQRTGDAERRD